MSQEDLLEVLEGLRVFRAEVQGTVEPTVMAQLDKAISDLEQAKRDEELRDTAREVLKVLGELVKLIPAIAALLKLYKGSG